MNKEQKLRSLERKAAATAMLTPCAIFAPVLVDIIFDDRPIETALLETVGEGGTALAILSWIIICFGTAAAYTIKNSNEYVRIKFRDEFPD